MRIKMVRLLMAIVILLIITASIQTTTRHFELSCHSLSQTEVLNVRVVIEADWSTSPEGCTGGGATISYAWDAVPNAAFYFVNGTIVGNITQYQAVSLVGFRVGPCVAGCACQPELFEAIANSIPNPVSVIARLNDGSNVDGTCTPDPFPVQFCGNLIVDPGEDCDDGNTLDNDGCPSSCKFSAPSPTPTPTATPTPLPSPSPGPSVAACNFSSADGEPERCFGGIGKRCEGIPLLNVQFVPDLSSCTVSGWMAVGSILHDKCCLRFPDGYGCKGPFTGDPNFCKEYWDEAVSNVRCERYWPYIFGPYPAGNSGDDTNKDLRAPRGARINPIYEFLCPTGRCQVGKNGKTTIRPDRCGNRYCVCE